MSEYGIVPDDGKIFKLILDGDASDPIDMVRSDGYDYPEKWRHTGKKVTGTQIRRFKLVRVGYYYNLNKVREKLAQFGKIPEGQWREALKTAYPKLDGNGYIGIADPSWVDPSGEVNFPFVSSDGRSKFRCADYVCIWYWRWLVEVC